MHIVYTGLVFLQALCNHSLIFSIFLCVRIIFSDYVLILMREHPVLDESVTESLLVNRICLEEFSRHPFINFLIKNFA